jgi:hypothetical protein
MSAAARAHVRGHFTMRQVNEQMRTFYREAAAKLPARCS